MGCWAMFRGSLAIEPPITEEDKKEFDVFVENNSYPQNPRARYAICWEINEENRLLCCGCKFGEYDLWLQFLYEKFFEPRGYEIHGTLLNAWDASQDDWRIIRVVNGTMFHSHYDPVRIDLDFWQESAEYTRQKMKEREAYIEYQPLHNYELKPEQYGGLFDPYDEPIDVDGEYAN